MPAQKATPASEPGSIIILGAGVFGASTAYHLIHVHPVASITLIDRSKGAYEAAASWDWQKVVRAEYDDIFYMRIALDAVDEWKKNPFYSRFYHCSGAVWMMENPDYAKRLVKNCESFGRTLDYELIKPDDLKKRYNGIFNDADLSDVGDIFVNHTSGWAQAKEALDAVIEDAVHRGVRNVAMDVSQLIFHNDGSCIGVEGSHGEKQFAERVLLCTGTYTAKLLADSAPDRTDIQVDERLLATGVITGILTIDDKRREALKVAPVLVHNVGKSQGETMPPTPDGCLKVTRNVSFTNTSLHPALGKPISAPPSGEAYSQWSPPQPLRDELDVVHHGIYGSLTSDLTLRSSGSAGTP